MADRKEIEAALIDADHRGDREAVDILAAELDKMDSYKPPSTLAQYGRSLLNSTVRPIAKAVTSLPGMAADLGVSSANYVDRGLNAVAPDYMRGVYGRNQKIDQFLSDKGFPNLGAVLPQGPRGNTELPTTSFNRALDAQFAPPPTTSGRVAEVINSAIAGAAIPNPTSLNGAVAPKGFMTAKEAEKAHKLAVLAEAQARGAAVPPATVNPNWFNRMLESFGGKHATAQQASVNNASNFTAPLVREAVGAPENTILDKATLSLMRDHAGQGYEAVRKAGNIVTPPSFFQDLNAITRAANNAARSFPELQGVTGGSAIDDAVNAVRQSNFDASAGIDAIKLMRTSADDAYAAGKPALGKAYKQIATALENAIEFGLHQQGKPAADMLKAFRESRTQIAKLANIAEATNPVTGETSAKAVGDLLKAGAPLSGELLSVGRFGAAFPKEGRTMAESVGVNQLTANMGATVAGASEKPIYLGLPLLGQGIRSMMLSPTGQRILTGPPGPFAAAYGNPMILPPLMQGLNGLFTDQR